MTEYIKTPVLRGFTEIEPLFDIVYSNDCYICGGYARYMCSLNNNPSKPSDIDIFCKDENSFNKVKQEFIKRGLNQSKETDNAISYNPKSGTLSLYACPSIQLIKCNGDDEPTKTKNSGSLEEIISRFDFSICRIGMINKKECLADIEFTGDEINKNLRINNITSPINTAYRVSKYSKKGYNISRPEFLKLFLFWDSININFKSDLIDSVEKDYYCI